jgi:S-adenosylmethionine decarboxylase proenzyme
MSNIVGSREQKVGIHLIVNLYGIRNGDLLSYSWKGRQVLNEVISILDLHIVGETGHQFHPYGYTLAYLLSESHLTIHTYPEYRSAHLDIFCCNPDFNPNAAIRVLKEAFDTESATHQIINR